MADSAKISFPKLNQSNWGSWKQRMEWLLEKEDLWVVVNAAKPDPETDDWRNRDRKARANIGLFLEDGQFKLVKNATSAREMWVALKEHHEKATMSTIVHYLSLLCSANLLEGDCMEKHLENMDDLFDKLSAAGQILDEKLQIAMIFRSVPESYRGLVQSLQSRDDANWTVALVKTRLLDEYNQRRERSDLPMKQIKAMKSEVDSKRKEKVCYFCKQPGHFRKNCRKWLAQKSDFKGNHRNDSDKAKQAKSSRDSVCFLAGTMIPNCWVIDSGATCHMTSDRSFFETLDSSVASNVTLADGNRTTAVGIGEGIILGEDEFGNRVEITLKKVLYVPGLDGGLISVSQLAMKGFIVKFGDSGCEIQNVKEETVVVGDKIGNLYRLRVQQRLLKVNSEHHERCQHTWHRRFGHRDPRILQRLEKESLVSGFDMEDCGARIKCECCLRGKLSRKPFPPISEKKTARPLEIIHTDVCGPMETITPSGNRYLMTLIDDFSRYTVVHLLKNKSEAACKIKQYVRWAENLFGRKPQIIRSDGGASISVENCESFMNRKGLRLNTQYRILRNKTELQSVRTGRSKKWPSVC